MKLDVRIGSKTRSVEIERRQGRVVCRVDGRAVDADVAEISPGTYSILLGGRAFRVQVETRLGQLKVHVAGREWPAEVLDPRQWRRRSGALALEGRQQLTAPMPGKVVRLLAAAGQTVEAGQGILVVEAMKMQNEIRAPKTGTLERLLVREGQAVNAGDILAVVA
jgi:biotin carboxyl carrier protein